MLLEIDNITLLYGRIQALHGISLEVGEGEIVALIGANGAGKSTTMRAVSGLRPIASGSIRFDGQDITHLRADLRVVRGISQAPEGRGIFPGMTVQENLDMGAYTRRDRVGIQSDLKRVFELFPRRLPEGRRYGVVAGVGRALEAIAAFRFTPPVLAALEGVVDDRTLAWLADYRFTGDVSGYAEGEVYFPHSPLLVVESSFAEAVLLETLVLSILNYDSAVASAASRMTSAAVDRPVLEMGARRAHEDAAVAAARAAVIGGFVGTSNLEAGRRYGLPTIGTAAHAFTLLHDDEVSAFASQVAQAGVGTTLLVDTYDVRRACSTRSRSPARTWVRCGSTPATWRCRRRRSAPSWTRPARGPRRSSSPRTSTSTRSPPSPSPRWTPTASGPRSSRARVRPRAAWSTSSSAASSPTARCSPSRRCRSRRPASAA